MGIIESERIFLFMNPLQTSFDGLGIAPKLLEILDKNNFLSPTPIQAQSIPHGLLGKDIMGIAQTGTGKTLAFGIPMIQRLAQMRSEQKNQQNKFIGLVVLPTRELALQVDESLNKIGRAINLKTALLIGGENMKKQIRQLRNNPHIIIATPGRLIDHLEQKTAYLGNVKILVLDEADRMLDMGFAPQIKKILENVSKERQTMLFSATMPQEIMALANSYMQLPIRVEVAPAGSTIATVTQEVFFVHRDDKLMLLKNLLNEYKGSILIFTRTKFGAKKLAFSVQKFGFTSAEIHSNRSLNQRLEALNGFKIGRYRILVATDIAARGIDVTGIELVINYDLPEQASDYVHRIGRTGRAGRQGHAISFATPEQKYDIRTIERLIKKQLPVSPLPNLQTLKSIMNNSNLNSIDHKHFRGITQKDSSPSFGGFKTPNRQAYESEGHSDKFKAAPKPKPLRNPFSKSTRFTRSKPKIRQPFFGNYRNKKSR